MKKEYVINEEDWAELMRLSIEASRTPAMVLSTADGLAGRDFASTARQRVYDKWNEIGIKYGFRGDDVEPVNEEKHIIKAEPLTQEANGNQDKN